MLGLLRRRPPPPPQKPLRDELLSIERLEERAKALAARFTLDPNPRRVARNVLPRFDENARVLRAAYLLGRLQLPARGTLVSAPQVVVEHDGGQRPSHALRSLAWASGRCTGAAELRTGREAALVTDGAVWGVPRARPPGAPPRSGRGPRF